MRIIHTNVDSVLNWIESNPEPATARRIARRILGEAIIHGNCSRESLKRAISSIQDPKALTVLEAFASSVLIASTASKTSAEKSLRNLEGAGLEEIVESEEWETAISKRSYFIESGQSRDDEFGRVVGRMISLPEHQIELVDQYLGEKIIKAEPVFGWFLKSISQRQNRILVIHTRYPQESFDEVLPGKTNRERVRFLVNQVERIASESGFTGEIKVILYTKSQHDRYWKFAFSEGFITLSNGYGLDVFRQETFASNSSFHEESPELWSRTLGHWRGSSTFLNSKSFGFESKNVVVEAPEFAFKQ